MKRDAIQMTVYQRAGALYVSPAALSTKGFRAIGVVTAAAGPAGLARALEEAERQALAVTKKPRKQRPTEAVKFWEELGCKTWSAFVKGTTAVSIVRDEELTDLDYLTRTKSGSLASKWGKREEHAGHPPLKAIAKAVLDAFAREAG